jgi:hypothetical protein
MAKYIGRQFNVGLGRETTRGTARAVQKWLPTTELTFDEKTELARDEASFGVIENQQDADVVKRFAEGSISGIVDDDVVGLVLNSTFGTVVSTASGTAYTHTFNILQSAQHQSLTITASEPNAQTTSSLIFPLAVIDSLELNFEVGAYPTYSASFMSNIGSSTTATVSYLAPDNFLPQQGVVRIATAYAGLASGTSYSVRTASISISKNVEDDHNIGSVAVTDRLNKQLQVSGTLELTYDSREFVSNLLNDVDRALRIQFTNTGKIVGAATNPSITFDLAKVKFTEVARTISNDDIVMQTVNFEGFYSLSDSRSIQAILVNDVINYV